MLNRINRWMHRRTRKRAHGSDEEEPSPMSLMPILPAQRPLMLTPTPSREELLQSVPNVTAKSGFFMRLPADLRRQILTEAFGGRTVHMDLSFDEPLLVLRGDELRRAIDATGHYGLWITANGRSQPSALVADRKFKTWEWWGCVCHRDAECRMRRKGRVSEPYTDGCRAGVAKCGDWAGDVPRKCQLGAMGWLRACRQAYVEGVEILYATNTVHMSSLVMMLELPNLLLPQRLAMITSVEMVWRLVNPSRPLEGHDGLPLSNEGTLDALLRTIPKTLPNLCHLNVNLMWHPGPESPGNLASRVTATLILPLDAMVRDFGPQLRDCSIGLYSSIWRAIRDAGLWHGTKYERGGFPSVGDRYWRPLPALEERLHAADGPGGYWISEGYDDSAPYPFAHMNPDFDPAEV